MTSTALSLIEQGKWKDLKDFLKPQCGVIGGFGGRYSISKRSGEYCDINKVCLAIYHAFDTTEKITKTADADRRMASRVIFQLKRLDREAKRQMVFDTCFVRALTRVSDLKRLVALDCFSPIDRLKYVTYGELLQNLG